MAEPAPFKYRAFLSYSHRDKTWGAWLHRALENHRTDKDLAGRPTAAGPVPKALRPIFRDREDFSAGHSLTEQTLAALEASQFLIVICSPDTAKSRYVNEEIRRFKTLGRAERVIPVIVDGEPGDPERECFPPALRFKLGQDGALTAEREEPIAADAREQGDGKEMAKQKIIAGLLGVGLDEIVRRAQRARQRRNRFWAALAGVMLLLTISATGSAVYAYQKLIESEERLDQAIEMAYGFVAEATAMSDRAGVPLELTLRLLRRADAALNGLMERGADSAKLRHRRALMLLGFCDSYRLLGRIDDWMSRAREAESLLQSLATDDAHNEAYQHVLADANDRLGDALSARDLSEEAVVRYKAAASIRKRLMQADPSSLKIRGELWASVDKLSNMLWENGKRHESLLILDEALQFVLTQAEIVTPASGPERARLNLAKSISALARATRGSRGVTASVHALIRAAFTTISADFADLYDGAANMNQGLWWQAYGDFEHFDGRLEQALDHYRLSLANWKALVHRESRNLLWQRHLARTYDRIGDVLGKMQKPAEVVSNYRASLAIRERLVASDPANVLWQLDLLQAHWRLASSGDDALTRLTLIVRTLQGLKQANKLTAERARWLPEVEAQLSRLQTAQPAPGR
ncbi:MAG: toll/interleukin-1 receptor domain-containing protein [Xanthobacteraceae bacterium]